MSEDKIVLQALQGEQAKAIVDSMQTVQDAEAVRMRMLLNDARYREAGVWSHMMAAMLNNKQYAAWSFDQVVERADRVVREYRARFGDIS